MIQAGGWLVSKDGKTATVNSAANIKAFTFVKSMIKSGSMKLTNQIGAGWGGEGFGKKQCAMTIEGNWISGAMTHDYPTVGWTVAAASRRSDRHQGDASVRRRLGSGSRLEEQGRGDGAHHVPDPDEGADGEREGLRRDAVGDRRPEAVERALSRSSHRSLPVPTTRRAFRRYRTSGPFSATSTSRSRGCRTRIRRRSSTASRRSCSPS